MTPRAPCTSLVEIETHLHALSDDLKAHPDARVRVASLLAALAPLEREFLTLLFIVPFLQPIPVWGVSSVLGVLLALMHGKVALRGPGASLPVRVARFELSGGKVGILVRGAVVLVRKLERIPRWEANWAFRSNAHGRFSSAGMAVLGVLLALPLPIPFSNTTPAIGLLAFSLAFITRNLAFLVMGHVLLLVNFAFFTALTVLPFFGVALLR